MSIGQPVIIDSSQSVLQTYRIWNGLEGIVKKFELSINETLILENQHKVDNGRNGGR